MRLLPLLVLLLLIATSGFACGGGGGGGDQADAGCSDHAYPARVSNDGLLAEQFHTCSTRDGTSLRLENVSSLVLAVAASDGGGGELSVSASGPEPTTFRELMVARAEPPTCLPMFAWCRMPPRAEVVVKDAASVRVTLDPAATSGATAAAMFAGWVESRFESSAASFAGGVLACANAARNVMAQNRYQHVEDAIREALDDVDTARDCTTLYRELHAGAEDVSPATIDAESHFAGSLTENFQRDVAVAAATRVIEHLR